MTAMTQTELKEIAKRADDFASAIVLSSALPQEEVNQMYEAVQRFKGVVRDAYREGQERIRLAGEAAQEAYEIQHNL